MVVVEVKWMNTHFGRKANGFIVCGIVWMRDSVDELWS